MKVSAFVCSLLLLGLVSSQCLPADVLSSLGFVSPRTTPDITAPVIVTPAPSALTTASNTTTTANVTTTSDAKTASAVDSKNICQKYFPTSGSCVDKDALVKKLIQDQTDLRASLALTDDLSNLIDNVSAALTSSTLGQQIITQSQASLTIIKNGAKSSIQKCMQTYQTAQMGITCLLASGAAS